MYTRFHRGKKLGKNGKKVVCFVRLRFLSFFISDRSIPINGRHRERREIVRINIFVGPSRRTDRVGKERNDEHFSVESETFSSIFQHTTVSFRFSFSSHFYCDFVVWFFSLWPVRFGHRAHWRKSHRNQGPDHGASAGHADDFCAFHDVEIFRCDKSESCPSRSHCFFNAAHLIIAAIKWRRKQMHFIWRWIEFYS